MNKKAMVTGASRGIGEAVARKLAACGYDLVLVCQNNIEKMNQIKAELEASYGIKCVNHSGNIGDSAFVASIFNELDSLDVLVNNAGISYVGLLQDMTDDEWRRVMNVNLDSIFYTSREAIKLMIPSHDGIIINISSMWGTVGASTEVAYSASKGAINSFTKALAKELAPSGIRVNAITCGLIDTDMNKCFSQEDLELFTEEIPAGRMGRPDEVASLVKSICDAPEYMTGQIIGLDGGYI